MYNKISVIKVRCISDIVPFSRSHGNIIADLRFLYFVDCFHDKLSKGETKLVMVGGEDVDSSSIMALVETYPSHRCRSRIV